MSDVRPGPFVQGKGLEPLAHVPIMEVKPCALPFELPKNFKDLGEKEKEEVCRALAEHNTTEKEREIAESNPSTILFKSPDGYREFMAARKLRLSKKRDEGEPIVVARETPEMLSQALMAMEPVSAPPPMPSSDGSSEDCETLEI